MSDEAEKLQRKTIDVEGVLAKKNPNIARFLPKIVINYLKHIVHQDEVNAMINKASNLYGLDFVDAILTEYAILVKPIGIENIPSQGRVIVASNHPLGGIDGVGLMQAVGRVRKDILFPVNDILLYLENLKPLFIPINKLGSNVENIRLFNESFASNNLICYFPFGLVSRRKNGKIEDLEWKKTFITKARSNKRDIIPTHISGRSSNFFYNLSEIRKKLGIRANIEMLYLSDEFHKQKGSTMRITFGKLIPWQTFDNRFSDSQWAEKLRIHSYELANNCTAEFNL
ncbi:MAG: glycerol acyltransferase [Bacteroidales bacterium]|nr:glycerol acyltransferase [Bacteroidales bacterium]